MIYSLFSGGAERLIETLVSGGTGGRYRHQACSLTTGGELAADMIERGADVYFLGKKKGYDASVAPRLASLIRRLSPSILHLHGAPAGFWGTAASILSLRKAPIVRTEHRPWIPEDLPFPHRASYLFQARRAARIIAVSDHARRSFIERFPSLAGRFVTIHNGIRTSLFDSPPPASQCRISLGLPGEGPLIGTVGRLVPVKNHALLLEAFVPVRDWFPGSHLVILGDGPLESDLRLKIGRLGLDGSVSLIPSASDMPVFFGALDLFVLSSDSEGLPLTLLEALASGLPAVATSVGGIPEIIEDGSTGLLVPPGEPARLAQGIKSFLEDRSAALESGRKGSELVRREFSAEKCSAAIEGIYDEILGTADEGS